MYGAMRVDNRADPRGARRAFIIVGTLAAGAYFTAAQPAAAPPDGIQLPPGFRIETYAAGVENARAMALGPNGTLFVGSWAGKVHAVSTAADGTRKVSAIASGLTMPNGVAFRDGALYVAERQRILRFDRIESRLDAPPPPVVIAQLPDEEWHGWRYIAFGPDGKLYVSIGSPCNVCEREGFSVIVRMNRDGSGRQTVARGVRNSVGFAWHPETGEMWFTDPGRDMLGDDSPSDELNRLGKENSHFGFPYCHGGDVPDPEFAGGNAEICARYQPPVQKLGAHVTPLGLLFYTGSQFPRQYRGDIFIAQHGSWNRSAPDGFRIMRVRLDGNRAAAYEPFATGWLSPDGTVRGRPVDLLQLPDGSLLVSDDQVGAIYRISFAPASAGT